MESEARGNAKAEEKKRAAPLLRRKEAFSQVSIQLRTQPGKTYDELKRAVVALLTYLISSLKRRYEAVVSNREARAKEPTPSYVKMNATTVRSEIVGGGHDRPTSTTNLRFHNGRG